MDMGKKRERKEGGVGRSISFLPVCPGDFDAFSPLVESIKVISELCSNEMAQSFLFSITNDELREKGKKKLARGEEEMAVKVATILFRKKSKTLNQSFVRYDRLRINTYV